MVMYRYRRVLGQMQNSNVGDQFELDQMASALVTGYSSTTYRKTEMDRKGSEPHTCTPPHTSTTDRPITLLASFHVLGPHMIF